MTATDKDKIIDKILELLIACRLRYCSCRRGSRQGHGRKALRPHRVTNGQRVCGGV